jgi:hypothetical protein
MGLADTSAARPGNGYRSATHPADPQPLPHNESAAHKPSQHPHSCRKTQTCGMQACMYLIGDGQHPVKALEPVQHLVERDDLDTEETLAVPHEGLPLHL